MLKPYVSLSRVGLLSFLSVLVLSLPASGSRAESAATDDFETPVELVIDVKNVLGPAQTIGDLIGSQYAPFTFDASHSDPWGAAAWREIGFNIGDIALFNFAGTNPYTDAGKIVGIHVTRGPNDRLILDYSDFDRNINFLRNVLHVQRIDFTAWGTPKPLADPAAGEFYFFHAPRSYVEWNDILTRAVRHIANDLHLKGATYKPWTEPDTAYYWRGHAHPGQIVTRQSDPAKMRALLVHQPYILEDYIEKYVNDWKVIKAADDRAKVSGAFNVWSKDVPATDTAFTLDQFLTSLDSYNQAHLDARVGVDEVAYQDYNWRGNGLAEGVIAANAVLEKHHLPTDIPLVLTGWNENNGKGDPNLPRAAAYITSNIITELIPKGRPRTLTRAYIWPYDYDYGMPLAPVVLPYRATSYSGDDGVGDPFAVPPITTRQKRSLHAALRLLAQMKPGRLVSVTCDDPKLAVLAAVQPDDRIVATMANYSERKLRISVRLPSNSTVGSQASVLIQRIDTTHSADGSGLEQGIRRHLQIDAQGRLMQLAVEPWSVVGIELNGT